MCRTGRFWIATVLASGVFLTLVGCSNATDKRDLTGAAASSDSANIESSRLAPSALTMQRWSDSCALCHASGVAAAPRVGNTAEWVDRIAKGRSALLKNTVEGFNKMPPLGYCMSCEEDDFVSMIEFMAGLPQGALK